MALGVILVGTDFSGVAVEGLLRQGDARDTLSALAASIGAGLIVVGSHGRRGIARALLGSVAEHLARTSTNIPVTVVHHTTK
jgi:nucleotide-binding universal stress UspA family protein